MKKIIPIILALVLLTGCGKFSNRNNIIDLLSSPKLSQSESQIISAIRNYMGEEVVLKYPKQSNSISPIQMVDIEGDGKEEAVVFYTAPNAGGSVWLAVLQQEENVWQVSDAKEGYGTEIASIDFVNVMNNNNKQIVVGYTFANQAEKLATMYIINEGKITFEHTENCQAYILTDVTGDNLADIVVASVNANGVVPSLKILTIHEYGTLYTAANESLNVTNSMVTEMKLSKTSSDNISAIIVDFKDNNKIAYTQGLYFDGEKLNKLFEENGITKYWNGSYNLLSKDVDKDGFVEIPSVILQGNSTDVVFMEWTNYLTPEPERKYFGVCDVGNGVFIALPEEWQGYIEINTVDKSNLWNITDTTKKSLLMGVEVVPPGKVVKPTQDQKVVMVGLLQVLISFDDRLEQEQKDYIANNMIYLK